MPSPSHARPPPPSPPPSGSGMLGGLKIAREHAAAGGSTARRLAHRRLRLARRRSGVDRGRRQGRRRADAAQATSTGAPRCAFVKRRPGRTISTATRPTRLWLFPWTTTTSIMYRPGARGRPWTRPVKRMRFSPLTAGHPPAAHDLTRTVGGTHDQQHLARPLEPEADHRATASRRAARGEARPRNANAASQCRTPGRLGAAARCPRQPRKPGLRTGRRQVAG